MRKILCSRVLMVVLMQDQLLISPKTESVHVANITGKSAVPPRNAHVKERYRLQLSSTLVT